MKRLVLAVVGMASVALFVPVTRAQATPITIPSGLNPGDTYYVAFVTADRRNAQSSVIADYDLFVTTEANADADLLALGTTWRVIGSTETVSAATHLGLITSPIYNLADQLVATGSSDLFDGAITHPIDYDQFGTLTREAVWTGSQSNGDLSIDALGTGAANFGISDNIDYHWISGGGVTSTSTLHLYGISGPLVVPVAAVPVPEPGTISLLVGPALLLFGRRQRRRRRLATPTTQWIPHH